MNYQEIDTVVIQWDAARETFKVINYNYICTEFPIQGLDPDLEVLVKRTPFAMPDYDSRLMNLVLTQDISTGFDPIYPSQKQWITTYSLEPRTAAELTSAVADAENDANYKVFPTAKQFKYMVLACAIIDRKASGLTITPAQQTMLDKLQAKASKIWSNHITANAKRNEITTVGTVNLDAGWEIIDPEA